MLYIHSALYMDTETHSTEKKSAENWKKYRPSIPFVARIGLSLVSNPMAFSIENLVVWPACSRTGNAASSVARSVLHNWNLNSLWRENRRSTSFYACRVKLHLMKYVLRNLPVVAENYSVLFAIRMIPWQVRHRPELFLFWNVGY